MSKQIDTNLFMSYSFKQAREFYQHLFRGIITYGELGNWLLQHVRTARAFRQTERVRELSQILAKLPVKEYQIIGQYHLVWCEFQESKCETQTLETVIDQSRTYKSKALITRAGFEVYNGNSEVALYFYTEALKANPTASDYIVASRGIALSKSMEGFHASALKDLESLTPLLRHADTAVYYDVLNSYAVELIENNRLSEAHDVSLVTVSSPFGPFYPEWSDTRNEIELRRMSRSLVAFSQISPPTGNLLQMPVAAHPGLVEPFRAREHAPVLDMQAWKKKMTKEDKKPRPVTNEEKQARLKELKKLKPREVILQMMDKIGDEQVTDVRLLQALIVLEELESLEVEQ